MGQNQESSLKDRQRRYWSEASFVKIRTVYPNCKMYFSKLQNVFIHIQLWDTLGNQFWKTDRDSAAEFYKMYFFWLLNVFLYIIKCILYIQLWDKLERQTETALPIWSLICSGSSSSVWSCKVAKLQWDHGAENLQQPYFLSS